jgi:hypothetical protein
MRCVIRVAAVGVMLSLGLVEPVVAAECPNDSVASGTVCMDKYQASVWYVPPEEKGLINKIQKGTVELAELLAAAGVQQLGLVSGDLADFPFGCPVTGNGCVNVYAVSIQGVIPARFITWFQMAAAARNSRKRLPTNQEWQVAALGTPDQTPGAPCSGALLTTGSKAGCVSDVGAFDMVGSNGEWVADWGGLAGAPSSDSPTINSNCTNWPAAFGGRSCVGGRGPLGVQLPERFLPGALLRSGVFDVHAEFNPSQSAPTFGFRCAR